MATSEATRPESIRDALGFDDIGLIASDYSDIKSRKDVHTGTMISRNLGLQYPIIASPMDTISDVETCVALNDMGAAGILHRFMDIEDQVEKAIEVQDRSGKSFVAVGLNDYEDRIPFLEKEATVDLIFLDTANGASVRVIEFMKWYAKYFEGIPNWRRPDLIVGNTMSKASVSKAFNLGADGVRHGIGIGSMCITSMQTGIHCPAVTSLYYAWKAKRNYELLRDDIEGTTYVKTALKYRPTILCDGGIRKPADLVKAIAAGADAVICGNIFAGCNETPGEVYGNPYPNDRFANPGYFPKDEYEKRFNAIPWDDCKDKVKAFRGMASKGVVDDYQLSDGTAENTFVEGEETLVPLKNKSVKDVVHEFTNGLKSAMSYLNCTNLSDLKGALWTGGVHAIKLSNSSYIEGTPHGK